MSIPKGSRGNNETELNGINWTLKKLNWAELKLCEQNWTKSNWYESKLTEPYITETNISWTEMNPPEQNMTEYKLTTQQNTYIPKNIYKLKLNRFKLYLNWT